MPAKPALPRSQLRQQLRKRCVAIASELGVAAGSAVARNVSALDWFQQATTIACYLNDDFELTTQGIIELIWQLGKSCYLPIVLPEKASLAFANYTPDTVLQLNAYQLLQPAFNPAELWIELQTLDLVFVPLLGFDKQGNRLGRGAGYYDKTFAFLNKIPSPQRHPKLVGLAYACQEIELLAAATWDVRLDAVVTEQGMMKFD